MNKLLSFVGLSDIMSHINFSKGIFRKSSKGIFIFNTTITKKYGKRKVNSIEVAEAARN